jgi:hypothetical protein
MKRNKCSFDYDQTLDRGDVQDVALSLVMDGWDVYIVTARIDTESALELGWSWIKDQNADLYQTASELGIPFENIIYTPHIDKIDYLKDKGFIFHLDDDYDEIVQILACEENIKGIHVDRHGWEYIIEEITKNKKP